MAFHEIVAADEGPRFEGYAAELTALQTQRAAKRGTTARALHVKQHVGVVGELTVSAPDGMRHGVFAQNDRSYPLYARFSNGASRYQGDKAPDARGIAVKLVGVDGKKIIPGLEDKKTQDFLFIAEPALPFRDPDEFVRFIRAVKDGPAKLLPRLFASFGLVRGFQVLRKLLGQAKVLSMATHPFYTAAPVRFGDTAAKLALVPLATTPLPSKSGDNQYRDDLVERVKAGPLGWSVRAQMFADDASTPIEDASVLWPTPWVEIGKLTIHQQDPDSPTGKDIADFIEKLSFDPWHAGEEHRPLGSIMRARGVAYRESVIARKAVDEPDTVMKPTTAAYSAAAYSAPLTPRRLLRAAYSAPSTPRRGRWRRRSRDDDERRATAPRA